MAAVTAGELFGYAAPAVGETVEIPIVLTDDAGAVVTGVAFNAAGMVVKTRKEGAHAFSDFPTFATENWAECGYGEYVLIIRQSDAGELALLDTPGTLTVYVKCDATNGNIAKIKVNTADVARDDQWTDMRAGKIDAVTEARLAELDAANLPANIDTIAADVAGLNGDSIAGIPGNTVTVTVRTVGGIVYQGVKVSITNQAETTAALVQYTNSSGQAVFYLDAGDWRAVGVQTAAQSGGATNFTVDGAEAVTVTVTATTLPAPADPDNYILYGYGRKLEADAAFGASGLTVKVIAVTSTGQYDATANATRHIMGTSYTTDSAGLWSIEIAQALVGCRLRLEFTWTDSGSITQTEEWEATIAAPASGSQLAWADLSPTKKA